MRDPTVMDIELDRGDAIAFVADHLQTDRWLDGLEVTRGGAVMPRAGELLPVFTAHRQPGEWIVLGWDDVRTYTQASEGRRRPKHTLRFSVKWPGVVRKRGTVRSPKRRGAKRKAETDQGCLTLALWWWRKLDELSKKMGLWKDRKNRGQMKVVRWLLQEAVIERLCQIASPDHMFVLPSPEGWTVFAVAPGATALKEGTMEGVRVVSAGPTRRHAWRAALLTVSKSTAPWPRQGADWPTRDW